MATQIGVVKALIGEVTATAADGSIRTLQIGDMVYANELVSTGDGGAVEIEFADGSVMDLGRNSQAMLDSEVFDPSATAIAETASDEVPDDIAAIQQALLEGEDPTQVGEATAAGAGVEGGNEGHEPVFVDYLNPAITPDAGFDTIGVTNEYDLPEEDIIILEEEEPVVPEPVVPINVTLSRELDPESEGVYEDQTLTYVATLDQASSGDITVTLSNGAIIFIPAGDLSGSVTLPAQGDDPYIDAEVLTANIVSVSGGGENESLSFDPSEILTSILDTIDTTTVTLDDVTVSEDGTITYTASVDNAPQGAFSVTLNNGVVINFADGSLTGSSAPQAAQGDDPYVDGESFNVSITSTSGGNYEALDTSDTALITINDTIDTTTVNLTATASTTIGGAIIYTATVDNAPQLSPLILDIYDETDALLGQITIAVGETEGTLEVVAPGTPDDSYDAYIDSATGGNYEDLNIADTASTIILDIPPSSALLITNSNVVNQEVRVTIASESGSNTTGVVEPTEVQGQEGSSLEFGEDVFFAPGETYTVTIEHVSGTPVILTDLSVSDSNGNVLNIYEGNAKLETGDTTGNTNFDGYIFNVTVGDNFASDPSDYSVSEPIGYEVLNQNLVLDTESNTGSFILDFSELSLNGGEDLFGDVESIDIDGKGLAEDNTIYLSAEDIIDLGTGGDNSIIINGATGDTVNLVDVDGGGSGTWDTGTDTGNGTTLYTYSGGGVTATAEIDNALSVFTNTATLDNS